MYIAMVTGVVPYLIIGLLISAVVAVIVVLKLRKQSRPRMALLSSQQQQEAHPIVGGVVVAFLENGEFVRAMETLIRRHKYSEAARVALLVGQEERASELFLRGKDYENAAEWFMKLGKAGKAAEAFRVARKWDQAAEMYLQAGNPVMAARMLLEAGQEERAIKILEERASEYERLQVMASVWAGKGEYAKAAQAFFTAGHFQEAAQAFEQAGDYSRAAQAFLKASKPEKAARALEIAGRPQDAVKLYEKAGLFGEAARAASTKPVTNSDVLRLANKGNLFEAGMQAFKDKDYPLTERLLRALKPTDKGYTTAALILGKICIEDGRTEEARNYLKHYLLHSTLNAKAVASMKFALKAVEGMGDLETCLAGIRRMKEARLLDQEMKDKMQQLEIRHVQAMMGEVVPLDAWVKEGNKPQSTGMDNRQVELLLNNRFGIKEKLGDSGVVSTFSALYKQSGVDCHIRIMHAWQMIIKPELNRIIEEAGRVKELRHPSIVQAIEGGVIENMPYVVTMEPPGRSLKDIMSESQGPLSLQSIISVLSNTAAAVDHAHGHGFVHKGLSPSCIYVSKSGDSVQVGCFGIPDARFDKHGPILWGDQTFLSPEALMGGQITVASDIYSYALLVIALLLGNDLPRRPVDSTVDMGAALVELRKQQAKLSLGVLALLKMSLSEDPRERPKTAQTIASEVVEALKHT